MSAVEVCQTTQVSKAWTEVRLDRSQWYRSQIWIRGKHRGPRQSECERRDVRGGCKWFKSPTGLYDVCQGIGKEKGPGVGHFQIRSPGSLDCNIKTAILGFAVNGCQPLRISPKRLARGSECMPAVT